MYKKIICIIVVLFFLTANLMARVTVSGILKSLDELQNLEEDVEAKVIIIQQDSEQGTKLMESIFYGRNMQDMFLIVMTKPESEKGNGYLKVKDNFWMYRRNTRTFQHINRDESIAGSDANAGDFENSKYQEHYAGVKNDKGKEIIQEEILGKIPVYKVEIKATVPDVDYPKKVLWVRRDNYLPLKEQSYSLSGTLMYTQYFLQYSKVNNKFISIKQLVVDEFEKGNKTLWEIQNISFHPIDDAVFTKAYLENLSK